MEHNFCRTGAPRVPSCDGKFQSHTSVVSALQECLLATRASQSPEIILISARIGAQEVPACDEVDIVTNNSVGNGSDG